MVVLKASIDYIGAWTFVVLPCKQNVKHTDKVISLWHLHYDNCLFDLNNQHAMAPELCMVKTTAARKFGLSAKKVKEPFLWLQLVYFAILYDIHSQGYYHFIVSTMAILFWDQFIAIVLLFALRRKMFFFGNWLFWN